MDAFERDLAKRLKPPAVDVPAAVDAAVLGAAARRFRWRRLRPAVAVAAGLLLALSLLFLRRDPLPGDVDGDGRVDILDAYRLALDLRAGRGAHDVNGDGAVDERDVDEIARTAVRLDG